ncbi:MAG: purine-nucleoside phosphorylase [Holophagales bacterium]|nr:purine-nucleoside phosphorylase [Holophagales bacterium]MYG29236.1 purine-nucleoside phosphorylase [Holophagales bacterium]MYI81194.1 purine-nucleoside phosphorylase [Holophagales bacterium]
MVCRTPSLERATRENAVNGHKDTGPDRSLAAELEESRRRWLESGIPIPEALLVTGSGLSLDLGEPAAGPWPFSDLFPFEVEAIEGHAVTAELVRTGNGRLVLYSRGRLHAYQGYTPAQVVYLVRLSALLGARSLVVTNAAGSLRADLPPGSIVAIADHINLTGLNPLRGRLPAAWGPQFPDLADAYDPGLRRRFADLGTQAGIPVGEGVYAGLLGPSFETPAEIRAYRTLGADLVGMSTVLEVIAARHMGLRALGFSLVTNMGVGLVDEAVDHQDVLRIGGRASGGVARLISDLFADEAFWNVESS